MLPRLGAWLYAIVNRLMSITQPSLLHGVLNVGGRWIGWVERKMEELAVIGGLLWWLVCFWVWFLVEVVVMR